ncbi:hypothetical protein BLA9940_05933 [Burkholderia aenigmatica]|uniref:hypothetical protein n=1 Tax=Burkholderia cepacia complex TaxID=87882 RepID=UPI000F07A162|nr:MULTISPECIES: hypothetical protein [Burkholderia cepacia complex]AYQ37627.1 hypothetical protein CVS37_05510 [Burkholderia lata]VWC97979.1 hypothetical protein BLA9940_05933 [Burkholderia aenigmatica]
MNQTTSDAANTELLRSLDEKIEIAEKLYERAAEALGTHVIEMAALITLRNELHPDNASGNAGGALFVRLRDEGLRVRHSDGRSSHVAPEWMRVFGQLKEARTTEIHAELYQANADASEVTSESNPEST